MSQLSEAHYYFLPDDFLSSLVLLLWGSAANAAAFCWLPALSLSHPGLLLWSCSYFFLLACFARWQPAAHIQQSVFLGQSCIALFCFSLSFSFTRMWPVCSVCSGLITAINDYKLACCLSLLVHWQFCLLLLLPEMPACLCVCPPPHWPFEWLVYGVCVCPVCLLILLAAVLLLFPLSTLP